MGEQTASYIRTRQQQPLSLSEIAKRIKNRRHAPLPPLPEGNILTEGDGENATFFADVLAIQNVPAAHYSLN
jgi:hypothetical protein